uniref:Uncharacterized protein n=1 Tax=Eutreptiella gymnastica TaxID=73025 RepID=A0A6T2AJ96_9EUGL
MSAMRRQAHTQVVTDVSRPSRRTPVLLITPDPLPPGLTDIGTDPVTVIVQRSPPGVTNIPAKSVVLQGFLWTPAGAQGPTAIETYRGSHRHDVLFRIKKKRIRTVQ